MKKVGDYDNVGFCLQSERHDKAREVIKAAYTICSNATDQTYPGVEANIYSTGLMSVQVAIADLQAKSRRGSLCKMLHLCSEKAY